VSARNRELLALIPASLLVTLGFAAIFIQQSDQLTNVSLTYGGVFLGLCFAVHLVIPLHRCPTPTPTSSRWPPSWRASACRDLPDRRRSSRASRRSGSWSGLVLFAATILLLRDFRVLERYRYTIARVGLGLLVLPRVPGIGQQVNGAYLGVGVGPIRSSRPSSPRSRSSSSSPPTCATRARCWCRARAASSASRSRRSSTSGRCWSSGARRC
jgi:hypothetical protein